MRRAGVRAGALAGLAVALVVPASLGACGSGASGAAPAPAASSDRGAPVPGYSFGGAPNVQGVVALGHSGITGFDTAPTGYRALQNSWATGSSTAVGSVYTRLQAADRVRAGRASNAGVPGSGAAHLDFEAVQGTIRVPHPWLVVIQDIGNDVTCDARDPANLAMFRRNLASTLRYLTLTSPKTKILIVGQVGSPVQRAELVASEPAARAHLAGPGHCALFDPSGRLRTDQAARLGGLLRQYEEAAADVCSGVRQCRDDGGAASRFVFGPGDLQTADWNHLSVTGQARFAAWMWPAVAALLGLGTGDV